MRRARRDGLGRRVSTVKPDQSKQIHVYTQDGVLVMSTNQVSTGAVAETRYVYLNGSQIAELGIAFIHTDGLRSPVARVDGNKVILSRTRYEPYGLTAAGATPTVGYTGHVNDANTGLVYMQQRYYDPVAAQFVSIDPVTTNEDTGSSFNRYSYAENNPYSYVDPDGRESESVQTVIVVAPRPAPTIWLPILAPIQASRPVDPLVKPWVEKNIGGSSTGSSGLEPDDDDDPRGRSRGSRSKTGKSDKHGDQEAMSKAQKDIDRLTEQAKQATSRKERMRIEKTIQNIRETAQRRAKGETHWMK